jgi:hypothetical protein
MPKKTKTSLFYVFIRVDGCELNSFGFQWADILDLVHVICISQDSSSTRPVMNRKTAAGSSRTTRKMSYAVTIIRYHAKQAEKFAVPTLNTVCVLYHSKIQMFPLQFLHLRPKSSSFKDFLSIFRFFAESPGITFRFRWLVISLWKGVLEGGCMEAHISESTE